MRAYRVSKRMLLQIAVFIVMCAVFGCTKEKKSSEETVKPSLENKVAATSVVLATIADDETAGAVSEHQKDQNAEEPSADIVIDINKFGKGAAYIAKVGKRECVVHNGVRGKFYDSIESFTLTVSPDGQRVGYGAKNGDTNYVVIDGVEKGPFTDRGRIAFSPDSKHVAYDAKINDIWYMHVDGVKRTQVTRGFDRPLFSSNSSKVAYVEVNDSTGAYQLVISDIKLTKSLTIPIIDPDVKIDSGKTAIAALVKDNNARRAVVFDFNKSVKTSTGKAYDEIHQLTFNDDGTALAYIGVKDKASFLVFKDSIEPLPDALYPWPFVVCPDNQSVGIFVVNDLGRKKYTAYLHHAFTDKRVDGKVYKEGAQLAYNKDGKHYAYVAIQNEKLCIVVDGKEGPFFDFAINPVFSPDSRFVVYRARENGKRFVVISDLNGKVIRRSPSYERVFEPTFTEDGRSVAYGVLDGKKIMWKVEKL